MNWEAISAISELVGAVAIVATLVYLAVQIRQNTASVKADAYQGWVSANINLAVAATNTEFSKAIRAGISDSAQLNEESEIGFGLWNHSAFQLLQAIDTLYQMGVIDEPLWKSEISRAAVHLSNPGVRQWWDAGGKTQLTPEFVERVESTHPDINVWGWEPNKGYVRDRG
jgi:hypothetical protein